MVENNPTTYRGAASRGARFALGTPLGVGAAGLMIGSGSSVGEAVGASVAGSMGYEMARSKLMPKLTRFLPSKLRGAANFIGSTAASFPAFAIGGAIGNKKPIWQRSGANPTAGNIYQPNFQG